MKKNISNSIFALIMTLTILALYFQGAVIENIELKFYDFYSSIKAPSSTSNDITLIEINDESLAKVGRWPWERSKIAEMITWLNSQNAKPAIIGLNILFSEPENNKSKQVADRIEARYKELVAQKKIREISKDSEFLATVDGLKKDLDNDLKLQIAISTGGNVVLPMFFELSEINSKPREEPEYFKSMAITLNQNSPEEMRDEASGLTLPIDSLGSGARAVGHTNVVNDIDGSLRRHNPFLEYNGSVYPSFPVQIANLYAGKESRDLVLKSGENFRIGKNTIALDTDSSMHLSYSKGGKTFRSYSFYDVINNKIVPEAFNNKVVLIGLTAHGYVTTYVTPVEKSMTNLEQSANVIDNLMKGDFIHVPQWAAMAEISAIAAVGLFAIIALPFLKAAMGAIVSILILLLLMGTSSYLFIYKGMWIKMTYPSALLIASYIFIVSKRFFSTEKKKELIEVSQIETNKMLGLSFQGQGMLDLAFEKFRLCPVDDNMKELLYNLGLDFERKRQFNKAKAVYEHVSEKDPGYKDLKEKIENLTKAADGGVFASPAGKNKESTILVSGSSATPTLGRYEVMKELGKGAMGIVYLGKDPKINRTVAIKTMRFEEGLEEKEMKALKERFFREAQAAGNLSHPNIVKIFDAGEDQDIAYMAMELLKGEDLKKYTRKENILPREKALLYTYQSALALDYAHKNGVVHRDIKPANIMLLEDGSLRVTDFGIARIQESSKTATGTVMGTPYYMSPEQIQGKKVDGRADLFSLGVTMYELLTCERPWKGGESVATLFYQITSEPYPDPREYDKSLSEPIIRIIDKALKKNPDERYQNGAEMAEDIKAVMDDKSGGQTSAAPAAAAKNPAPKPAANPAPAPAPKPAPATTAKTPAPQPATKPAPAPVPKPAPAMPAKTPLPQPAAKAAPAPAPAPKPAPRPRPAALDLGGITVEKEPKAAMQLKPAELSLQPGGPKKEPVKETPKSDPIVKDSLQLPISETLNQSSEKSPEKPAPLAANPPGPGENGYDFEKTLPLIYPEEEGGGNEFKN
ncbi:MAG: serine/threonine protein kinase [Elusimicrobia bacterium CG08_land_8_20_14_0_20_51_18]|nr:MAG: serine/threonine protein kinase [Elusimicrobia bacterium CG08_land_8_20_14_0_20_51_18]